MPSFSSYIAVFIMAVFASTAHAQARSSRWTTSVPDAQETVTDLGHGVYMLSTNFRPIAGNITVAVGENGIIVVDTQWAPLYDKIKAAIKGISPLPVRFVINTHHHGDHTGGNPRFGADGAVIIAQTQAARHLAHPLNKLDGTPVAPMAPEGLPSITFDTALTVRVGDQTAELYHPPIPAHTDDDTLVIFRKANVISTGDLFTPLLYPHIDTRVGGGIDGMITAVDVIDKLADDKTVIVPGHGVAARKADLVEYRAMLVTARDRIAKAKAAGMTERQVIDANLLVDLNPRWVVFDTPLAQEFAAFIYQSVK